MKPIISLLRTISIRRRKHPEMIRDIDQLLLESKKRTPRPVTSKGQITKKVDAVKTGGQRNTASKASSVAKFASKNRKGRKSAGIPEEVREIIGPSPLEHSRKGKKRKPEPRHPQKSVKRTKRALDKK